MTTQVLSIKVSKCEFDVSFLEFILLQTSLEELAIHDTSITTLNSDEHMNQIKFPLKKVSLHKSPYFLQHALNITTFADKIAPALEEVELGLIYPFSHIVYEEIFKKSHKLQVLDIFIKYAPKASKLYRKLIPNHSLKELFIQDYKSKYEEILKGLIVNAPNLETLNIRGDGISKDLLHFISISLPNLKQLFAGLPYGPLGDIKLSSLTTIVVRNLKKLVPDWTGICNAMPNIKAFAFKDNYDRSLGLGDSTIKVCTENWNKLEVVNFLNVQLSDVELILKNCVDIKSVVTCAFPDDQEASAAIQAIEKNGRRLVHIVPRRQSLIYKYHKSLWDDSLGRNDAIGSLEDEDVECTRQQAVELAYLQSDDFSRTCPPNVLESLMQAILGNSSN